MIETSSTGASVGAATPHPHVPTAPDWGRGHYERTARQLTDAAEAVVRAGRPRPGERVLDIGCGTGSVALRAARAGACVAGVDPASRLLRVAGELAHVEGLEVELLLGDAGALPLPTDSVDVVLSNFGLIFATDPPTAVAELDRVLKPAGRVAFSAWLPGGTIAELNAAALHLVREAVGSPMPPASFAWHDDRELARLFAGRDLKFSIEQHELVFTAASPAEFLAVERKDHPLAVAGFEILERTGRDEEAHEQLRRILEDGNEDASAFKSTSRYVVVTAVRG